MNINQSLFSKDTVKRVSINVLVLGMSIIVGCSAEQNNQAVAKNSKEKASAQPTVASNNKQPRQLAKSEKKAWGSDPATLKHNKTSHSHEKSSTSKDFSGRYTTISENIRNRPLVKSNIKKDKISVVEFFNYGCPACNAIEPALEQWKQSLGKDIEFTRVPVVFHSAWLPLAKAYYAAEKLNVQEKITPYLFKAIHQKKENLTSKKSLSDFFANHNVKAQQFDEAYDSFYTDRSLERGRMLMSLFGVYSIPTIVVNNTYKTDVRTAGGNLKDFVNVLNYLVDKSEKKNKEQD